MTCRIPLRSRLLVQNWFLDGPLDPAVSSFALFDEVAVLNLFWYPSLNFWTKDRLIEPGIFLCGVPVLHWPQPTSRDPASNEPSAKVASKGQHLSGSHFDNPWERHRYLQPCNDRKLVTYNWKISSPYQLRFMKATARLLYSTPDFGAMSMALLYRPIAVMNWRCW